MLQVENAVKLWLYPILMSIVGFFSIQIWNDIKDIKKNQEIYLQNIASTTQKISNIEQSMVRNEREIKETKQEVTELFKTYDLKRKK